MRNSLIICILFSLTSFIFSVTDRTRPILSQPYNSYSVQQPIQMMEITATCSCSVKSGFEAWAIFCTNSCASQSACITYAAFCTWTASSSTTNTTTNTSTTNTTSNTSTPSNTSNTNNSSTNTSSTNTSTTNTSTTNTSTNTNTSSSTTCQCQTIAGFEAWGAYCVQSCNDGTNCLKYTSFCTWTGSGTSTNTSTSGGSTTPSTNPSQTNSSANPYNSTYGAPDPNYKAEHGVYLLTWQAPTASDIMALFKPACDGLVQQVYISFAKPTQADGLTFLAKDSSVPTTVLYNGTNQPAINVYRDAITKLNQQYNITTLISVGGWDYQADFDFLVGLSASDALAWAQKVKDVIDSFGAQGLDIDYEQDSTSLWTDRFISNNLISILRQVMPKGQYLLKQTIAYAAAMDYVDYKIPQMYNPALWGFWCANVAVGLVQKYWDQFDQINIMSYASDPKLDPTQTLNLTKFSIDKYMGIGNSEKKLVLGGMIGPNGCTTNWCNWNTTNAQIAADFVYKYQFQGMFWWPSTGYTYAQTKPFYQTAYNSLYSGQAPTALDLPGVCN